MATVHFTKKRLACLGGIVLVLGAGAAWWLWPDPGDRRLAQFVHARPPVPVVFTSRTQPASFAAPAAEGDGTVFPGQRQWQAQEGRLRLLTPRGSVHELTWGNRLPNGDRLIDVMSPNVSPDGRKIVFAGRRYGDHGRFRIFEVEVSGRNLKQLTGRSRDKGTTALPPMRYRNEADAAWPEQALLLASLPTTGQPVQLALASLAGPQLIVDHQRCRVDYDDVDPVYLTDGSIAFISSRIPDLGRGHSRRATHLWVMAADGSNKRPVTSNRNNDRWPFMLASGFLAFSEWSRNTEVVTADLTDIQPYHEGMRSATAPTDAWQGLRVAPNGDQFGVLVKLQTPVWRPRPLFNGQYVFMTNPNYGKPDWETNSTAGLEIRQAPINLVSISASATPAGAPFPKQEAGLVSRGPVRDGAGRRLVLATPSPCPDSHVLFSAAPLGVDRSIPEPGGFALYLSNDRWEGAPDQPVSPESVNLTLLFDDPQFVDAEPVAVYRRDVEGIWPDLAANFPGQEEDPFRIALADGQTFVGSGGEVVNGDLYLPAKSEFPGQVTDRGEGLLINEPPAGLMDHIRFFASHRDRFDHPFMPRVPGAWEYLLKAPLAGSGSGRSFSARVPAGVPTVLAGFTKEGKIAQWESTASDSLNRRGRFFAYAGDHYNSFRPGEHGFCMGCHAGHTGIDLHKDEKRR